MKERVMQAIRDRGLDADKIARDAEWNFRAYRLNDHVTCSCCTGRASLCLPPERKFLR